MSVKVVVNPQGYLRFRIYWRGRDIVIGTKYREGRARELVEAKAVLLNAKLEQGVELHRALLDVLGDCPPRLLPRRPAHLDPTIMEWAKEYLRRLTERRSRRSHLKKARSYLENVLLPLCGTFRLSELDAAAVDELQAKLLARKIGGRPIRVKTAKNILSGHLAAVVREARRVYRLPERDPFDGLVWPDEARPAPDPFTADERDRIIDYFRTERPRWFPWIATLFWTGMRPSEAAGLNVGDVDLEAATLSISRGFTEGEENAPKTLRSVRTILLFPEAAAAIAALPARPFADPDEPLFLSAAGGRIGSKEWPKKSFYPVLARLGIRRRKFYATRHTFISHLIVRGEPLQAIAEYCGTSVSMIERSYGRWLPKGGSATVKGLRSLEETGRSTGRFDVREAVGARTAAILREKQGMVPRGIEHGSPEATDPDSPSQPRATADLLAHGAGSESRSRKPRNWRKGSEDAGRKPDGRERS